MAAEENYLLATKIRLTKRGVDTASKTAILNFAPQQSISARNLIFCFVVTDNRIAG